MLLHMCLQCPSHTHLVVRPGEQHGDDVKDDVAIGPEGVGRGILPRLETTPIDQIMKLRHGKKHKMKRSQKWHRLKES